MTRAPMRVPVLGRSDTYEDLIVAAWRRKLWPSPEHEALLDGARAAMLVAGGVPPGRALPLARMSATLRVLDDRLAGRCGCSSCWPTPMERAA